MSPNKNLNMNVNVNKIRKQGPLCVKQGMKRVVFRLIGIIRRWKISARLVALFFVASFFPMILISGVMYRQTSVTLYKNINKTIASVNEQTSSYISEKVRKVISDSVEISNSELVQNILMNYEEYDSIRLYQMTKENIRQMSNKYVFNDIVTEITLYMPSHQKVNLYGPYTYRFKPTEKELEVLTEKSVSDNRIWFSFGENNSMILFRPVKNKQEKNVIGYLMMRIDENRIAEIYPDSLSDLGTESFVMNSEGVVISSNNDSLLSKEVPEDTLILRLREADQEGGREFQMEWDGKQQIVNYSRITGTDWYIVSIIPETFFRVDIKQLFVKLLVTVMACLLVAVLISLLVAFSIQQPMNAIIWAMRKYGDESSDILIEDGGNDELKFMADTFNKMSVRLNRQMEDIRKAEKQKRKLEIQALQAQINPHFIANTLNLISSIAGVNDVPAIEKLSDSLVDLVRDCCRYDERFVFVSDEISMLQSYINIQDYRMLGKFAVQMQIDPSIMEYLVPHLILQPIVENAILHGIMPDKKKRGLISIQGYVSQGTLIFSITDNGKGMEPGQIERILSGEGEKRERGRFNSIGIHNVQQRIQLLFGEQYGLQIFSTAGVCTSVTVRLPLITEQEVREYV